MIHRTAVVCLEIVLALVVGLVIVGAVLAWRLSEGPIVLDGLSPYVERMLTQPGANARTEVGTTMVAWSGWNRALDLRAQNVRVIEADGRVRARVDTISVALSPRALMTGQLAPKRIDVIDPRISVVRTADGGWRLLPETEEATGDLDLAGLLRAFSGDDENGWMSELREIDVTGARIRLVDDQRGVTMVAHGVSMALVRTSAGLDFDGAGILSWEDGAHTPVEVAGAFRRAAGTIGAEVRVEGLPLDALAELHPTLAPTAGLALPVSGTIRVGGTLGGAGFSGDADLALGPGTAIWPGLIDREVQVASGRLRVGVTSGLDQAELDAKLDLTGPVLTLSATALRSGSGYDVVLDGAAETVPVDALAQYWPDAVGPPAREWVTTNLVGGEVPRATAQAKIWLDPADPGTLRLDALGGQIAFSGVAAHYFRPLPPVTGVAGVAVYDADSFDIAIASGGLYGLSVEPSRVLISGLVEGVEVADIDLAVRGPLADALRVIDHEPLGYPRELGLDAAAVEGLAGARLRFNFPLLKELALEQVAIAVSADLTAVRIPEAIDGHTLSDAKLHLELTEDGMEIAGNGMVLGVRSEVWLDQRFHRQGPYTSRGRLAATATRATLVAFGLDLGTVMDGRAHVEIASENRPDGTQTVQVTADLLETRLSIDDLHWEKPPGASGSLRARLTMKNDRATMVDEFDLKAADLAVEAAALLGPDGQPRIIDFVRLRIAGSDGAGRAERLDSGEWRVALKGTRIDLSPLLDDDEEPDAMAGRPAIDLRLAADTLILGPTASFTAATLAVRQNAERLESLDLRGRIGDGYASLIVQPIDGHRRLTLRADDAGAFLQAFDIVDTFRGGRLGVDGRLTGAFLDDGLDAVARIEEFRVVDAPVLAQLLSIASFTSLGDAMRGDGIRFARARVDLTMTPARIEARNGVAYGPGLGLKVEGAYDRSSELMDFVGLIAPAYSLSRLIDRLPVIGELLTGGEGEGLLATEFRVRGTLDAPTVTVNPLTALAPGFLRDLLTTSERPADAPVVVPAPSYIPGPGPRGDLGR